MGEIWDIGSKSRSDVICPVICIQGGVAHHLMPTENVGIWMSASL